MNSLHKLIEDVSNLSAKEPALQSTTRAARHAQSFWLKDLSSVAEMQAIPPELWRLPYSTCWFEWVRDETEIGSARFGVLAVADQAGIGMQGFIRPLGMTNPRWIFLGTASQSVEMLTGHGPQHWQVDSPWDAKSLGYAIDAVMAAVATINCTNAGLHQTPAPAALNKKRERAGKVPLFSYWTLQIEGRSESAAHAGGTHASPRVHLRRGHLREHLPGKWCWVRPCAVGDRSRGVVMKDYELA